MFRRWVAHGIGRKKSAQSSRTTRRQSQPRHRRNSRRRSHGLGLETLESRYLLAASGCDVFDFHAGLGICGHFNDSAATATNFGVRSNDFNITNQTLFDAGGIQDFDVFAFTTVATGSPGDRIRIDTSDFFEFDSFSNLFLGNVQLSLFGLLPDGSTSFITSSRTNITAAGSAQISLAGLRPATYLVQVHDASGFTISGNYALDIDVPAAISADVFEPFESSSAPYNLGLIDVATSLTANIHAANDDDWFVFETASPGNSSHFVRLEFDSSRGDLNLALYDANLPGSPILFSGGTGNVEQVSLSGLPGGRYVAQVYGNGHTNPQYTLTFSTPPVPQPDQFETGLLGNNFIYTSTLLGSTPGQRQFSNLSIHAPGDVDWFQFQTLDTAGFEHEVRIDFDNRLGNLDLALYDSAGNFLGAANSLFDNFESALLAGLPPGTYYAAVYGQVNANYSLSINLPDAMSGDAFEDNDVLDQAANLGVISGVRHFDDLSVHAPNDNDWYRFEIQSPGTAGNNVRIDFDQRLGNLDLVLFDAAQTPLAYSAGITNREQISLAGLPAGTYYVWVGSFYGSMNPYYRLSFDAPQSATPDFTEAEAPPWELGEVTGRHVIEPLSIHAPGDIDWFAFRLTEAGGGPHAIRVEHNRQLGQLDAVLYDDAGVFLGQASGSGRLGTGNGRNDEISLAGLGPGNYLVGVYSPLGETNPYYALRITAPGGTIPGDHLEPNDTSDIATDFHHLHGIYTLADPERPLSIHAADDEDWFRFELTQSASRGHWVGIVFDQRHGDLDLTVYPKSDSSDSADLSNPIGRSAGSRNLEAVHLEGLERGVYFVHVAGHAGATNPEYGLFFSTPGGDRFEDNNVAERATQLGSVRVASDSQREMGAVSGFQQWSELSIHAGGDAPQDDMEVDVDWFEFALEADAGAPHFVQIDFQHALGDLELSLYDDDGTLLQRSNGVGDQERISLDGLTADGGPYRLRVAGFAGATSPFYSLSINAPEAVVADRWEDNDTRLTASDLGVVRGLKLLADADHPLSIESNDDDWFRFETSAVAQADHFAAIVFDHRLGDLDLALMDADGNLIELAQSTANFELIDLNTLSPGEYFLRVSGHNGAENPRYGLAIFAPGVAGPDAQEPNDVIADATNLGPISGHESLSGLSLHEDHDVDMFVFEMQAEGRNGHVARIDFSHLHGNLDLALITPDGQRIESTTSADREQISLAGRPAGVYRIEVFGKANPAYSLVIVTPEVAGDFAEQHGDRTDNNVLARAYDLREVRGNQVIEPLSIHAVDDVDWFRFELADGTTATAGHRVAIAFDHTLGDLDLQLFDSAGNVLPRPGGGFRESMTADDIEQISLAGLAAADGPFYARISGHRGATNPRYALLLETPGVDAGNDWSEPNDVASAATPLHQIEGTQSWSGLALHDDHDVDWFEFSLLPDTVGTAEHQIELTYQYADGNLNLTLYAASDLNSPLATSDHVSNRERISLAGIAAAEGPFLVKVAGAASPNYVLSIDAPRSGHADWAERHGGKTDNDSLANAYDLRLIHGNRPINHLSIAPAGDVDIFRFETAAAGRADNAVRIDFRNSEGNLSLRLLDEFGNVIAASETSADFEEISLADQPTGTYFVEVTAAGVDGTNPNYSLRISAPYRPGIDRLETNDVPELASDLRRVRAQLVAVSEGRSAGGQFFSNDFTNQMIDSTLATSAATAFIPGLLQQAGVRPGGDLQTLATNPGFSTSPQFTGSGLGLNSQPSISTDFINNFGNDVIFSNLASLAALPGLQSHVNSAALAGGLNFGFGGPAIGFGSPLFGFGGFGGFGQPFSFSPAPVVANPYRPFDSLFGGLTTQFSNTGLFGGGAFSPGANFLLGTGAIQAPSCSPFAVQLIGGPPPCRRDVSAFSDGLTLQGLSLHEASDVDWFRFELAADGSSDEYLRVLFDSLAGELEVALFADDVLVDLENAEPIDTAIARGDSREIKLGGLIAGTYFVRISGDAVLDYELQFFLSNVEAFNPDWAEDNDTRLTAHDLRGVEGRKVWTGLSIHDDQDVDWFSFQTHDVGNAGDVVQIDFQHRVGDLDLVLYDVAGVEIARSETAADSETVSLSGLAAGTYLVQVLGYAGAASGEYTLTVVAPTPSIGPDFLEPNNSTSLATSLDVQGRRDRLEGLSIHAGDNDYFSFTLPQAGKATHRIGIEFDHEQGDLQLKLYDGSGNQVAESSGTGNDEFISLNSRPAGKYFARVHGADALTANEYRLVLALPTATDPEPDIDHWTVMVYMTANNLEEFAFSDLNEMEAAAAALPASVNLVVLLDQTSGLITDFDGRLRPGRQFATGDQAAWGDVGRAIIRPDRDMSQIATTFERIGERNTGDPETLIEFVSWAVDVAPANRYALVMWDHGSGLFGTNEDSESGNDVLLTSELVSALEQLRTAGIPIELDVLSFDACLMAMAEVAYAARNHATVMVASQENEGGDGYDYRTAFLSLATVPERILPEALASGIVASYAQQYGGTGNPNDTHSATLTAGMEQLAGAIADFVTTVLDTASAQDWQRLRTAIDGVPVYNGRSGMYRDLGRFMLNVRAATQGGPIAAAADTVIGRLNEAVVARTIDVRNSQGLAILLPRPAQSDRYLQIADVYASQHAEFVTATRWNQFLSAFVGGSGGSSAGQPRGDWAGRNGSYARAYNLRTTAADGLVFPDLQVEAGQQDWFRFSTAAAGELGHRVALALDPQAATGLRLAVLRRGEDGGFESMGETIAGAVAPAISLQGLPPGEYFVRVDATEVATPVTYDLLIDAPATNSAEDWAAGNDRSAKARDLGTVAADLLVAGLTATPQADDWFSFGTPRLEAESQRVVRIPVPGGRAMWARLYDDQGQLVDAVFGNELLELAFRSGAGARFRLQVSAIDATPTPFHLYFVADAPAASFAVAEHADVSSDLPLGTFQRIAPAEFGDAQFALINGPGDQDNDAFTIVGNELHLRQGVSLNTEDRDRFSIRVRADDGEHAFEKSLSIEIEPADGTPSPWQNSGNRFDVNNDNLVTPLDVVLVVNHLNATGSGPLPAPNGPVQFFVDVNGNNSIGPDDVLAIINHINDAAPTAVSAGPDSSTAALAAPKVVDDNFPNAGWLRLDKPMLADNDKQTWAWRKNAVAENEPVPDAVLAAWYRQRDGDFADLDFADADFVDADFVDAIEEIAADVDQYYRSLR